MELHPNPGDPVVLRDQDGREYGSRVEDFGAGLVVVARPNDLPADEPFAAGTAMSVVWPGDDGEVLVLPAKILIAHASDTKQLWSLVATGPASTAQRRRAERVAASGPIELLSATDDDDDPVTGTLVDASEAAIRCTVAAGAADRFLTGSGEVLAAFRIGAADFTLPGVVQTLRSTKHPAEFEDLVVLFHEPVRGIKALRKELFALRVEVLDSDGAE